MRILMTAARCYPHLGGVEKHVESVRRELLEMGIRVQTFETGEGLRALRSVLRLARVLRREKFDVVHAHDFMPLIATLLAKILAFQGWRVFVTIHGYEAFPLKRLHVWAHRFAHAVSIRVVAVGAYIDRWYGTRSHVVTHGGTDAAGLVASPFVPCVTFVGRLARDTNALEVARAFVAASKAHRTARFKIYGFGELELPVKDICAGSRVEFCGETRNVAEVLEDANLVVANSYLAILEAFSMGRPVIAFYSNPLKRDYLAEIAEASKALIITDSVAELSRLICDVLEDRDRHEVMAERGRCYADRFLWRYTARDYVNLWTHAC